jgi:uncharacterized membrane protein YczE
LALFGAGISLVVGADLGLGPWDVFHQGLSKRTGLPIGTVIILVGSAALLLWIPLRQQLGLGTLLNTVEIGLVVNVTLPRLRTVDAIAARVAFLAGGLILVAVGSGLYIGSRLGPGPRDGLMVGLHQRCGLSIRAARTLIEISALTVGWMLGGSVGVGTVLFAVAIGPLVQVFLPRLSLPPLDPYTTGTRRRH